MSKIFNQIQIRKPKRNKFDLSHEKKLSFDMGYLIPILYKETMPGDHFKINTEVFLRFAPMLAPIMHRVNVHTHYFKVPIRLIWDEWQDFITGGVDGTSAPIMPWFAVGDAQLTSGQIDIGSLADYLGVPVQNCVLPTGSGQDQSINALPFRAYQLIYNEYYRDQTLTPEVAFSRTSGDQVADIPNITPIRLSSWEKDYFTSALPWPQRGPEMLLPTSVRVDEVRYTDGTTDPDMAGSIQSSATGELLADSRTGFGLETAYIQGDNASTTINDLRTAIRIQEWLEKNARGGSRYIEQILHHFGVVSSDARLQRPEYLGGGKQTVKVSEVLSTVDDVEPQGTMTGHGISAGMNPQISTYCEEHCIIMGIMRVLPRTAYQDGLQRDLRFRASKFEYPWPELAHLGEQEIATYELYYNSGMTPGTPEEQIFGYQSRYAEHKFSLDSVHGYFRTNLNFWHMGRIMPNTLAEIVLNEDFITADVSWRNFAVTDPTTHRLYAQVYHHISALRPLPYFGTPRL